MKAEPQYKLLHDLTLISVGAIAYMATDFLHEAVGHGLTSLLLGNKITLLTSVYFRSNPHSFITDAFGPLVNLVSASIIYVAMKRLNSPSLYIELLLMLIMAFNFFWFSWMCIYCGITNKGDFAFYISSQLGLGIWRFFLVIMGIISYYYSMRRIIQINNLIVGSEGKEQFILIPYFSACICALVIVAFYRPLSFENFYEAFMFPMFLPILFLSKNRKDEKFPKGRYSLKDQKILITLGAILFISFCFTMGQGLKF